MKHIIYFIIPVILSLLTYSCSEDNILIQPPGEVLDLRHIQDVSFSGIDISLYNDRYDSLTTGYNEIYFKIKKNGIEQKSGTLKLYPKMWMSPTYLHSTAVQDSFMYDVSANYFKGYIIFNMPTSPPDVVWYGVFTFIEPNHNTTVSDSIPMDVIYDAAKQWRFFYDSAAQCNWMLSLTKPFAMKKGMNDVNVMLHKTDYGPLEHEQIRDANMSVSVFTAGGNPQTSNGNVSPVIGTDGIYHGKINLPESGSWILCDTIWQGGRKITGVPPPYPTFYFTVE